MTLSKLQQKQQLQFRQRRKRRYQRWKCTSSTLKQSLTSDDQILLPLFTSLVDDNDVDDDNDHQHTSSSSPSNNDFDDDDDNNNRHKSPFIPLDNNPGDDDDDDDDVIELRFISKFIVPCRGQEWHWNPPHYNYSHNDNEPPSTSSSSPTTRRRPAATALLKRLIDGNITLLDNSFWMTNDATVKDILIPPTTSTNDDDDSEDDDDEPLTFLLRHNCSSSSRPPVFSPSPLVEIRTDILAIVKSTAMASDVIRAVADRIALQLTLARRYDAEEEEEEEAAAPMRLYRYYHYRPWGWEGGPSVTVGYLLRREWEEEGGRRGVRILPPNEETSPSLTNQRKKWHERFSLPLDRPLLRLGCAICPDVFESPVPSSSSSAALIDVHVGITPSSVKNGTVCMIRGSYRYHHYLQDGINDKGWGCAYRSLQTIHSWYQLNGYLPPSSSSPLTHETIQKTLVSIGDKPSSIINSREWIGSIEVGYVLNTLLGVDCRTIRFDSLIVPDDDSSSSSATINARRKLAHHFNVHGTPVMMGGGQLAFTIIGLDWNIETNDCAFLILDPHYVGSENWMVMTSQKIKMMGYKAVPCGWRRVESFERGCFYQLCLPERPVVF